MSDDSKFWWPRERSDRLLIVLAAVGFIASVYLLFFYQFDGRLTDATKVGVLRTEKSVRRRHGRTLHWADMRREGDIYLHDIVYTPKDATAVVTLRDGRAITLEPDSMVQFDEMTLDGIQITLFDFGLFQMLPFPKLKGLQLLPDPRPLELRHAEVTDRLRDFLRRPPQREKMRTLGTINPLNNCSDYALQVLSPLNDKYNLRRHRWINLMWTPVPIENVTYGVELSRTADFKRPVSLKSKSNRLVVQFDDEGFFFWRISAKCSSDATASTTNKFAMSLKQGRLEAFIAEVAKDKEFFFYLRSNVVDKPKCPTDGLPAGMYYCRIRPVNGTFVPRTYELPVN